MNKVQTRSVIGSSFNLIEDPWIPIKRQSGTTDIISPHEIIDHNDPPQYFNFPRADWNLAAYELMIGLIYAACPPGDVDDWEIKQTSLNSSLLADHLNPLTPWFNLSKHSGADCCFLQDHDNLSGDTLPLTRLLIDAPGAKTVKDNADLIVKRKQPPTYSQATAAIALYCFQSFAPAGGQGNRTSMRGGGPMVTLVQPDAHSTLWDIIWANVPDGIPLPYDNAEEVAKAFPWSTTTPTSEKKGSAVQPPSTTLDSPHWGVFFGMPRRIQLEFSDDNAVCDITGKISQNPAIGFRQKNFGIDYGTWKHPCSPYYRVNDASELLPLHPKPGIFSYQHYLGVVLEADASKLRQRADCVNTYKRERQSLPQPVRLIIGGWAMDNMRALEFIETHQPAPLAALNDESEHSAVNAVQAANTVASQLFKSVNEAISFSYEEGKKLAKSNAGPASLAKQKFFIQTQNQFEILLIKLAQPNTSSEPLMEWLTCLSSVSRSIFDDEVKDTLTNCSAPHAEIILKTRRILFAATSPKNKSGKKLYELLELDIPNDTVETKEKS